MNADVPNWCDGISSSFLRLPPTIERVAGGPYLTLAGDFPTQLARSALKPLHQRRENSRHPARSVLAR